MRGRDAALPTPPLQGGNRLTRPEFERRYGAMPHLKKAELIEGRLYMPSPVPNKSHGCPHAHLIGWLAAYAAATPGVELSADATVRLDLDNEPQPDALLRIEEACGGASRISEDDYIEGAYRALAPDADGQLESRTFPGLRLNADALLEGELARVLDEGRAGTETENHAAFVQQLETRREA